MSHATVRMLSVPLEPVIWVALPFGYDKAPTPASGRAGASRLIVLCAAWLGEVSAPAEVETREGER